jgi:hypothetical protein
LRSQSDQFKLCLIDKSEIDESLKIALYAHSQPTALLVYKSNVEHNLTAAELADD